MLNAVEWAEDGTYRPGEINSPEKFFNDCLENSIEFDLQLGYFSSAAISVLADGFATFISKGGRMRLIINHIVSDKDKKAISKGVYGGVIDCFDLTDFESLRQTFDEYQQQFFDCLAYLIANKRIDIRIIKPLNKKGISHTKAGQFRDGDSITSFTGSANFTISGLFNNLEEIKIDRSDSIDMMVQKRIVSQREEFDSIMERRKKNVEYLSPDDLVSAIMSNYGDKEIEELLDVETKLRNIKKERTYRITEEHMGMVCEEMEIEPRFPYEKPHPYQEDALEEWKKNGYKGLFNMATGTGKTITSLNCLLSLYKETGCYKAIILVPTIPLVDQWDKECRKFHYSRIYKISSKSNWKAEITRLARAELLYPDRNSFIIISTYASFVREATFERLSEFSLDTLLIADEAHNMGSPTCLRLLDRIPYVKRIGLSATPERQYDEIGNQSLCNFFGCLNKYTFLFTMKEAIDRDYLCHYRYFPYLVTLNEEEMEAYRELSAKIAKFYDPNNDSFNNNQILTSLLLKRKRIIHKAQNKLVVFKSIINEIYNKKKNLSYLLVYVPEGVDERDQEFSYASESDLDTNPDQEQMSLINQYTYIIENVNDHITVEQVTSKSQDREGSIKRFASGETQVLTAMKCLDEGVDVPRTEMAIFCASTGNPRQFVQRRGRILRTHKDKSLAYIYDLVVVPKIEKDSPFYNMERSMLKKELERVIDFASLSTNSSYAEKVLFDIINYYNLKL